MLLKTTLKATGQSQTYVFKHLPKYLIFKWRLSGVASSKTNLTRSFSINVNEYLDDPGEAGHQWKSWQQVGAGLVGGQQQVRRVWDPELTMKLQTV